MRSSDDHQYAELLTSAVNYAVVQLPKRQFPGVVIQGDSLFSFVRQLDEMKRCLEARDMEELGDNIDDLADLLTEALKHYESVCAENGIELPYPKR